MRKLVSVLLAAILLLSLAACGGAEPEPATEATTEATEVTETTEAPEVRCRELCDAGMDALENGDFAAAREAFEGVLAIDEGFVDAYLGLSEVLIREYDFEAAEALLAEGLEKTGSDPAIAEKLEMLQSASIVDSDGKLRGSNCFDGEGNLCSYILYTYLPDGKPESLTSYDADGNQTGHVLREYDSQGRMTVGEVLRGDELRIVCRVEYVRDDAGNVLEEYHYTPEGALDMSMLRSYDEAGRMIRREVYHGGRLNSYQEFFYDANGWQERMDHYGADGRRQNYLIYVRDEQGRETGYFWYDGEGVLFEQRVIIRDENGTAIRMEYYDGAGNLTQVVEYE